MKQRCIVTFCEMCLSLPYKRNSFTRRSLKTLVQCTVTTRCSQVLPLVVILELLGTNANHCQSMPIKTRSSILDRDWSAMIGMGRHWSALKSIKRNWSALVVNDQHWSTLGSITWFWSVLISIGPWSRESCISARHLLFVWCSLEGMTSKAGHTSGGGPYLQLPGTPWCGHTLYSLSAYTP